LEVAAAAPQEPSAADAHVIDGFVEKFRQGGIIEEIPGYTPVFISEIFVTTPYDAVLTSDEQARCDQPSRDVENGRATGIPFALSLAVSLAAIVMASLTAASWLVDGAVRDSGGYLAAFSASLASALTARKHRVVVNLRELNGFVTRWSYRLQTLWALLAIVRPGGYFAKADVASGFYHIGLGAGSRRFVSFRWRGRLYSFTRLPMGLTTSPALFSWLTGEVNRWLRESGVEASIVYIDDFILYGHTYAACSAALALLRRLCAEIGLVLAEDKTSVAPVQRIVALGLEVDSTAGSINIPAGRLVRTFMYAIIAKECAAAGLPVPGFFLASLAGSVGWLGYVNPLIRPFTHVVTDLIYSRRSRALRRVTPEVLASIDFLLDAARGGLLQGQALLPGQLLRLSRAMWVTSDASTSAEAHALAYTLAGCTTRVELPDAFDDIVLLEFLAPVLALIRHGAQVRGAFLIFGIDNTPCLFWGNGGRASRADALDLLRVLYAVAAQCDVTAVFRWLPRWINHVNDRVVAEPDAAGAGRHVPPGHLTTVRMPGRIDEILSRLLAPRPPPALGQSYAFSPVWAQTSEARRPRAGLVATAPAAR